MRALLISSCCSYELELLEFEPPDEEKERGLMTFEERLEAAERRRQDGNALFKAGQTTEALSKYRCAAMCWPQVQKCACALCLCCCRKV
jgi:hypothetical protein